MCVVFTSVSKPLCTQWLAIIQVIKILFESQDPIESDHIHIADTFQVENLHLGILGYWIVSWIYYSIFLYSQYPFYTTLLTWKTNKIRSPVQARIILKDCLVSRTSQSFPPLYQPLPHISILHLSQLPYLILHETLVCYLHYLPCLYLKKCSENVCKLKLLNFVIFLTEHT